MKALQSTKRNVLQFLAAIPAVFVAVVSHFVACPACWPLVGGLISVLGLTSLLETRLMLPLFVGCLLLAIAPLAFRRDTFATVHFGSDSICICSGRKVPPQRNCGNGRRHCHSRRRIRLELSRAACD